MARVKFFVFRTYQDGELYRSHAWENKEVYRFAAGATRHVLEVRGIKPGEEIEGEVEAEEGRSFTAVTVKPAATPEDRRKLLIVVTESHGVENLSSNVLLHAQSYHFKKPVELIVADVTNSPLSFYNPHYKGRGPGRVVEIDFEGNVKASLPAGEKRKL